MRTPSPAETTHSSATSALGVVVMVCGVLVVAVLTLADRVPMLFERARGRVELLHLVSVPGDAFTFGHFVAWAALATVAAMTTRRAAARLVTAVALAATSIALEASQLFFTSTRSVEIRDLRANVAGVIVGTIVGATVATITRATAHSR